MTNLGLGRTDVARARALQISNLQGLGIFSLDWQTTLEGSAAALYLAITERMNARTDLPMQRQVIAEA
jgi:hypothetical protein